MNAVELLTRDHRDVESLFSRFQQADAQDRGPILADIIRELSVHAAIEEAHVYPLIRAEVPGGERMVGESIKEHQALEQTLARLDDRFDKAHTKEVADIVAKLEREVEHHVSEEEGEVFPKLREAVTAKRLDEVGRDLREAKSSAPTRPHPNQPPATPLTARANAAVDAVRDAVSRRS